MTIIYQPFQPTLCDVNLNKHGLTLSWVRPNCALLRSVVFAYLQIHCEKPSPYPVIPDGTQAFYMSNQGVNLGGSQTEARDIPLLSPGEYFGLWFYPASLRHFFNLDQTEIARQIIDNRDLGLSSITELHSKIYDKKDFISRITACEKWLQTRISPKPATQLEHALGLIYQSQGGMSIKSIAEKVGRSSRHLNRLFLEHTGLNTKTFSNVIRVQSVCKQIYSQKKGQEQRLTQHTYFDQAHLIKEFKKHLKQTPSSFAAQLGKHPQPSNLMNTPTSN